MGYPDGLQLGGGVTSENAADFLNAGASHVIVTSFVFREGRLEEDRLQELVCCEVLCTISPERTVESCFCPVLPLSRIPDYIALLWCHH